MLYKLSAREALFMSRCPRCSSSRIYITDNEFVCLSCSMVAILE